MSTIPVETPPAKLSHWLIGVALAALAWFAAYSHLAAFADWLVQALVLHARRILARPALFPVRHA
jgi:hypothetical protein